LAIDRTITSENAVALAFAICARRDKLGAHRSVRSPSLNLERPPAPAGTIALVFRRFASCDRVGDAAIATVRSTWRRAGRAGLLARSA
jgi:hypothetical protein